MSSKAHIKDLQNRIIRFYLRLMAFQAVNSYSEHETARNAYLQNAAVLVPKHDYEIEMKRASLTSSLTNPPKEKEEDFVKKCAQEIFDRDICTARRFKSGEVAIGGKVITLPALMLEESRRLDELTENLNKLRVAQQDTSAVPEKVAVTV